MAYISHISIENIRCFKKLDLRLAGESNQPYLWNMIVGDNSTGKTCLLRCIAIGLCDESSGIALIKELEGSFLRKGEKRGEIRITLRDEKYGEFTIITTVYWDQLVEKVEQSFTPESAFKLRNRIFFCGYGSQRAGDNNNSFTTYQPIEAVYSLFNYKAELQHAELIIRRRLGNNRKVILEKIEKILMLDEITHTNKPTLRLAPPHGVVAVGPWGSMPMTEMSDGYWSTYSWLVDFIGWFSYKHPKTSLAGKQLRGIVLLDELDLHLHPRWQRFIVARLFKQFPHIQFITTTHSPLVAAGSADLGENSQLIALQFQKDHVEDIKNLPSLKGMRADQVLTSKVFGLATAISGNTGAEMVRFKELFLKNKLSKDERKEFVSLRKLLEKEMPEAGETAEERQTQREIRELLLEVKQMMAAESEKA